MAKRSAQPRRHRMLQQARRESARAWVASGAPVSVKAFARRYGVDCYTAYADLIAIGFCLGPGDNRWAVRPAAAHARSRCTGSPAKNLRASQHGSTQAIRSLPAGGFTRRKQTWNAALRIGVNPDSAVAGVMMQLHLHKVPLDIDSPGQHKGRK